MGFWDFLYKRERYNEDYFDQRWREQEEYAYERRAKEQDGLKKPIVKDDKPRKLVEPIDFEQEGVVIINSIPSKDDDHLKPKQPMQPSPSVSAAVSPTVSKAGSTVEPFNPKRKEEKGTGLFVTRPIYREKKNVITIVLENTSKVYEHKDEILRLVKKIVDDNKLSFFLFLRSGNDKKFFDIMDFNDFDKDKMLENLFPSEIKEDERVDMVEVLNHIYNFLDSQRISFGAFEYKEKKYDLQKNNIIFVGTAAFDDADESKSKIASLMDKIRKEKRVKVIKYFCMEDKETINAAMLGFPVIGHIVSDFYK